MIEMKDIQRHLNQQPKEALMEEIVNLIKTFPEVKEYYHTRLFPTEHAEVLLKYKKIIQSEFFPLTNKGARLELFFCVGVSANPTLKRTASLPLTLFVRRFVLSLHKVSVFANI